MSIMFRQLQIIREQTNLKQIKEDIANFVISDLEAEGFEPKLVKITKRKWKIIPTYTLSDEEQTRFDKIKDEQTELYKSAKMDQLKDLRKATVGR